LWHQGLHPGIEDTGAKYLQPGTDSLPTGTYFANHLQPPNAQWVQTGGNHWAQGWNSREGGPYPPSLSYRNQLEASCQHGAQ